NQRCMEHSCRCIRYTSLIRIWISIGHESSVSTGKVLLCYRMTVLRHVRDPPRESRVVPNGDSARVSRVLRTVDTRPCRADRRPGHMFQPVAQSRMCPVSRDGAFCEPDASQVSRNMRRRRDCATGLVYALPTPGVNALLAADWAGGEHPCAQSPRPLHRF